MKTIIKSLALTILNIVFMTMLILLNSNEGLGSILHQMIVFFSILFFFGNTFIVLLSRRLIYLSQLSKEFY
jgi:hypothetical protein